MASQGAKVLQTRSVEMAMNHRVRLQVLSSFTDTPGTLVVDEDEIVEKRVVSGIAYSRDEAKITVQRVADRPGVAAAIFGPLADNAINVDMIVQNISADGKTDLTFTVSRADLDRAVEVLQGCREALGFAQDSRTYGGREIRASGEKGFLRVSVRPISRPYGRRPDRSRLSCRTGS